MRDPREKPVADPYPTPSEREQAKARMLCDRADALEQIPATDQPSVLRAMDRPRYDELQAEESLLVARIADDLSRQIYDRPLGALPLAEQLILRTHAALVLRLTFSAWRAYALNQAVGSVHQALLEDFAKVLPPAAVEGLRGRAAAYAGLAVAVYRDALASTNGMPPGQYLRLSGRAIAEKAGVER